MFVSREVRAPGSGAQARTSESPSQSAKRAQPLPGFSDAENTRIAAVQGHVDTAADEHSVDPALINGLIWVESRFQPKATSPAGAKGLMQLMPATAAALAKQLGESRPKSYDPAFNVRAGTYYLKRMIDKYDGDVRLALAAYNAGAGNVNKWMAADGLPERSENYITKVLEARERFLQHGASALPAAPAIPEEERTTAEPAPAQQRFAAPLDEGDAGDPMLEVTPVFEPHPELDMDPYWGERSRWMRPARVSDPEPRGPAPVRPGLGVLPGVDQ